MKKYLVIGNPIDHSLSPKLHNHWLQENKKDKFKNLLVYDAISKILNKNKILAPKLYQENYIT